MGMSEKYDAFWDAVDKWVENAEEPCDPEPWDWSKTSEEVIKEIIRQGEIHLASITTLATAADQRATNIAGFFVAASTAVGMALAIGSFGENPISKAVLYGGLCTAVLFFVGAVYAMRSVMPTRFWLAGHSPEDWKEDVEQGVTLRHALRSVALHICMKVDENNDLLRMNSRLLKDGVRLGLLAPPSGGILLAYLHFQLAM